VGKNTDLGDFSEIRLRTPQDVHFRLQGRSGSGERMINPVTGVATNFAFTGDPVTETGWIGIQSDVRSLFSAGSFFLPGGGSLRVTLAITAKTGARLSDALDQMRRQFQELGDSGMLESLEFELHDM
jgi:hypothetical protein